MYFTYTTSRNLFKLATSLPALQIRNFANKMGLPRVFFDLSADGQSVGRIIIEVSENLL